jgi:hypothetical protein
MIEALHSSASTRLPPFRAFGIPTTFSSVGIIVVAKHVANNIPATNLYSYTCICKMRDDRLSDKKEERHI